MMDVLDRETLDAHDNFLARRLVVLAWCYHDMIDNLPPALKFVLPLSFFTIEANLTSMADLMWQEHGDWAYQQQKADLHKTAVARLN